MKYPHMICAIPAENGFPSVCSVCFCAADDRICHAHAGGGYQLSQINELDNE